jgi:hypothetical protein
MYFGKYPSQALLEFNAVGTGVGNYCGTIPPGDLSPNYTISPGALILGLSLFLALVTAADTCFAWLDRSIALQHFAEAQEYCLLMTHNGDPTQCEDVAACEDWVYHHHLNISSAFCMSLRWEPSDSNRCIMQGHLGEVPCCLGCNRGGLSGLTGGDEGALAQMKTIVSLIADAGTLLLTLTSVYYAISLFTATDNIDVMIKHRSAKDTSLEVSRARITVPLAMNFIQNVFTHEQSAKNKGKFSNEPDKQDKADAYAKKNTGMLTGLLDYLTGQRWASVNNFRMDDDTKDWEDFFDADRFSPPESRWTARVDVPRHLLGIPAHEEVKAAWIELAMLPPAMTIFDLLFGGFLKLILPFGKTRHAIIVTDSRLFYVRHMRPCLPLKFMGTSLRIDIYRHDHEVIFAKMQRTKVGFLNRLVHQIILREQFLPGVIYMQTKFGVIQFTRAHGDAVDVFHLISRLSASTTSQTTSSFIDKKAITDSGILWDKCQADLLNSMVEVQPGRKWHIKPQPDDQVEPTMDIYLIDKDEQVVFHHSMKDMDKITTNVYQNTDIVVTTARIFFWERKVYKKFDCMACPYFCFVWLGCLNKIFNPRHLGNSMSFLSLPSVLSFSTDMSVEQPSWLVPHQTPLKIPLFEAFCAAITALVTMNKKRMHVRSWNPCPKRCAEVCNMTLRWRLRQSAHADQDMLLVETIRPYVPEEIKSEQDAKEVLDGLGYVVDTEDTEKAQTSLEQIIRSADMKVETLRKIMSVVQDRCERDFVD